MGSTHWLLEIYSLTIQHANKFLYYEMKVKKVKDFKKTDRERRGNFI